MLITKTYLPLIPAIELLLIHLAHGLPNTISEYTIPQAPALSTHWTPVKTLGNPAFEMDEYGYNSCGWPGMYAATFDDGPDPDCTGRILASLAENNVKATFFWVGANIRENRALAKAAFQQGHHIASHSYSHPHLTQMTMDQVRSEITETENEIQAVVGMRPKYFRPPYGELNLAIFQELTARNYKVILWSTDTNDWRDDVDQDQVVRTVADSMSGSTMHSHITLMHDNQDKSSRVASQVLSAIASAGYKQVPLYICLNDAAYQY